MLLTSFLINIIFAVFLILYYKKVINIKQRAEKAEEAIIERENWYNELKNDTELLVDRFEEKEKESLQLVYRFEQIMNAFEEVDLFLYTITKSKLFSQVYVEHEPIIADLLKKIKNLRNTIGGMFNIDPADLEDGPDEEEEV
jgi:hypothetical protein